MEQPQALTLKQYNQLISSVLRSPQLNGQWVIAELSDVSVRNHCYLELIEKDAKTGLTTARMRGIIWAGVYASISATFERETGQRLASGLKVMVKVSVNYHEQYGISVIISDINPSFTLGDMARKRIEILKRLEREGIINDNKNLEMPRAPQRIAIISSSEAAGYGDFMNQLTNNAGGFVFYTALFDARMQGVDTPSSVISALERVAENMDMFDCVLITRGGGATSDLNWFDDYDLAANVAQFPLPVITAIGHERDNTVLDYISCLRVKTPTAAAEWLIGSAQDTYDMLTTLTTRIADMARTAVTESREKVTRLGFQIPAIAKDIVHRNTTRLQQIGTQIPATAQSRIATANTKLGMVPGTMATLIAQRLKIENVKLTHIESTVNAYSPERTLKRGYSITRIDGKAVTSVENIAPGTTLTTTVANGTITSKTL